MIHWSLTLCAERLEHCGGPTVNVKDVPLQDGHLLSVCPLHAGWRLSESMVWHYRYRYLCPSAMRITRTKLRWMKCERLAGWNNWTSLVVQLEVEWLCSDWQFSSINTTGCERLHISNSWASRRMTHSLCKCQLNHHFVVNLESSKREALRRRCYSTLSSSTRDEFTSETRADLYHLSTRCDIYNLPVAA